MIPWLTRNFMKKGIFTDFVCGSPLNERHNRRSFLKQTVWSFNYRTGECEKREHPAGDEQWNTFASQEQCVDFCALARMSSNSITIPSPVQPQLCDAKAKTGCPLGFECVKTSPFAAICCRTTPVCPAAESIALVEASFLICFAEQSWSRKLIVFRCVIWILL
ncbi:Kunitz/Bovine pancreatic trypsin inhibitor domain protein [Cooperia oncophora]